MKQQRKVGTCVRCGYISSQKYCKACVLLEGLNKGLPRIAIGRHDENDLTKENEEQAKQEKEIEGGEEVVTPGKKKNRVRNRKRNAAEDKEKEKEKEKETELDKEAMTNKLQDELKKVFDI